MHIQKQIMYSSFMAENLLLSHIFVSKYYPKLNVCNLNMQFDEVIFLGQF